MSTATDQSRGSLNQIISALPGSVRTRLDSQLERVMLQTREILFDYDQPVEYMYFPETCVASVVAVMSDGGAVETATIGNEGMVGLPVFHGTDRTAVQCFAQVPGDALRMPSEEFRAELTRESELATVLNRYTQALFVLVAESSAGNRLHSARQRCARWLLMTQDRVASDVFPLTRQFLSQMLGVRRATVTQAAGSLHPVARLRLSKDGKSTAGEPTEGLETED